MNNKKRTTVVMIAIVSIAVLAVSILIFTKGIGKTPQMHDEVVIIKEERFDVKDIEQLNIKSGSTDYNIKQGTDSKEIIITQFSNIKLEDSEIFTAQLSGDKLLISNDRNHTGINLSFSINQVNYVEVILPEKIFREVNATMASGNINFDAIKAENIKLKATSGDIVGESLLAKQSIIEVTSGNVDVNEIQGSADFTTTSGDITIDRQQGNIAANATSGQIKILSFKGGAKVNTTSGDVKISNAEFTEPSSFKASSGYIKISISGDNDYCFNTKSSSGSASIGKNNCGTDNVIISITTSSGDITVE